MKKLWIICLIFLNISLFSTTLKNVEYIVKENYLVIIFSFDNNITYEVKSNENKTKIKIVITSPIEITSEQARKLLNQRNILLKKYWFNIKDSILTIEFIPDFKVLKIEHYFLNNEHELIVYLQRRSIPKEVKNFDVGKEKFIKTPITTKKEYGKLNDFVYFLDNKLPNQAKASLKEIKQLRKQPFSIIACLYNITDLAQKLLKREREQKVYSDISQKLDINSFSYKNDVKKISSYKDYSLYFTYWQAYSHYKAGELSEGIVLLEDLRKNHPDSIYSIPALFYIALMNYGQKKYNDAYILIKKAYEEYKLLPPSQKNYLSLYAMEYPFFPDSINLQEGIDSLPYDFKAYFLYYREKISSQIIPFLKVPVAYKLLVEKYPKFLYLNPEIFYDIMKTYFKFKDYDTAYDLTERYLTIYPLQKDTLTGKIMLLNADCLRKLGKTSLSEIQYQQIIDMYKNTELDLLSRMRLAKQKSETLIPDRMKEANEIYDSVIKDFKNDPLAEVAYHNKGINLYKLKDYKSLLKTYWNFMIEYPESKEEAGFSKLAINSFEKLADNFLEKKDYYNLEKLYKTYYFPYLEGKISYNLLYEMSKAFYDIFNYSLSQEILEELLSLLTKKEQIMLSHKKLYDKALYLYTLTLKNLNSAKYLEILNQSLQEITSMPEKKKIKLLYLQTLMESKNYKKSLKIALNIEKEMKLTEEEKQNIYEIIVKCYLQNDNYKNFIIYNNKLLSLLSSKPDKNIEKVKYYLLIGCKEAYIKKDKKNLSTYVNQLQKYPLSDEEKELIDFYKDYLLQKSDLKYKEKYHTPIIEFQNYLKENEKIINKLKKDTEKY